MSEPSPTPSPHSTPPGRHALGWRIGGVVVLLVLFGLGYGVMRAWRAALETRLLTTPMEAIPAQADLVRFAAGQARPLFLRHCAVCHGEDLKGRGVGAPDLTDSIWLYGGGVFHIERTILYGIRSGAKKANDITEMPAYGLRGQLSQTEIHDLVQYLLKLNHRPNDAEAAFAGEALYQGKGECFDCHAGDAKGTVDYGAPDLTANVWDWGGDPQSLYKSIYYGRHGVMPAWKDKLTLEQIRALAVYVDTAAKR
jgi:cytochrome c oxidase cbb3-type subunit 3